MKYLLSIFVSVLSVIASASEIDPIVNEVVMNNPALNAEKAALRAEVMARVADNRLEATEVGFGYKWQSIRNGETKMDVEVSQSFDWPGVYGARRRAARAAEQALNSGLEVSTRALRLEVATLLCQVVDANLRCDMLRTIVNNLDSLHGSMHTMLRERQITELDHRKVALEEVSMKQQLADAEAARTEALQQLARLNGGSLPAGSAELRTYGEQSLLPLEKYVSASAPEILNLHQQAETMTLDARAERMGLYPGLSIGYAFEREGAEYFHGISLGITLPSYSAKPRAEAARWQARALELRAEQAQADRCAEIAADHSAAQLCKKLLDDYAYAFGSDYPSLLKRSLAGGQLSYIEYFSELNFYLTARLDYLSRLLTYNTLLTTLNHRL